MIQKLSDQLEIAKHRIQTLERIIIQQGDRLHQLSQKPVNVPKKVVVKYFQGGDRMITNLECLGHVQKQMGDTPSKVINQENSEIIGRKKSKKFQHSAVGSFCTPKP